MNIKQTVTAAALSLGMLGAGFAIGQQAPVRNVNGHNHPNIAAAQRLCDQAFAKISAAQQDNEYDMGGHAQKAKDLLDQASRELRAAATDANQNHR